MPLHRSTALITALSLALAPFAAAQPAMIAKPARTPSYEKMVAKVANMIDDGRAATVASRYDLNILNVLWEDTGRWEGSSVGPNISDVTIEVEGFRNGKTHRTYLMPVMRHDNYVDKTADAVSYTHLTLPTNRE